MSECVSSVLDNDPSLFKNVILSDGILNFFSIVFSSLEFILRLLAVSQSWEPPSSHPALVIKSLVHTVFLILFKLLNTLNEILEQNFAQSLARLISC